MTRCQILLKRRKKCYYIYIIDCHDLLRIKFPNVIGPEECSQHNLKVKNLLVTFPGSISNSYHEQHGCVYGDKERKGKSLNLVGHVP